MDQQKEMGFFETPEPLARKMLIYANLLERDIVLELSAGRGAIIRVLPSSQRVHAVEIDPDHVVTPGIYVKHVIEGVRYEKRIERRTVTP